MIVYIKILCQSDNTLAATGKEPPVQVRVRTTYVTKTCFNIASPFCEFALIRKGMNEAEKGKGRYSHPVVTYNSYNLYHQIECYNTFF